MRKKRLISLLTSAAICAACIPIASAEGSLDLTATIGVANSALNIQSWNSGINVTEGSNTVSCTLPKNTDGSSASLNDIGLLVIDLEDCYYDIGEVAVEKILVDGEELEFDESAVVYGADDGANGNNFRIELFSIFGETKDAPPFDPTAVTVSESVTVVFSVSADGYSGGLKKVNGNVVANKNSSSPIAINDFSLTITTSEEDSSYDPDNVRELDFYQKKNTFSAELKRGIYDFTVSREGYVTREFKGVRIGKKNPPEFTDLDLRALGDVDGSGAVKFNDIVNIAAHIKHVKNFSDSYDVAVADCTRNGTVDIDDLLAIASHVKGISKLK